MMQYCFSNIDYYFSGFEQTGDLHHSASMFGDWKFFFK